MSRLNSGWRLPVSAGALLLGILACSPLLAGPVAAQTAAAAVYRFDLPRGPLGEALRQFGKITHQQIVFDESLVKGRASPGLQGDLAADAALGRLLAGSGLSFHVDAHGVYVVGGAASAPLSSEEGAELAANEIIVWARRDPAETQLSVDEASSSDRSGVGLRGLPQATTVVTSALISAQQLQSITEALRNVSGAVALPTNPQGTASISVRGFGTTSLTNGLETSSGALQPMADIERIEVLKGPAAILQGADNLGGSVNIVTKKPSADPILDLTGEYGSHDDRKLVLDASHSLNADKTFSARLIGQAQDASENWGGYEGRNQYLITPSLRYKDAHTDVTVGASWSRQFNPITPYTVIGNVPGDAHFGEIYQRPDVSIGAPDQGQKTSNGRFYFEAKHELNGWLSLIARGEHYRTTTGFRVWQLLGTSQPVGATALAYNDYPDSTGNVSALDLAQRDESSGNALDAYARANFKTGPVSHVLSVGFNYAQSSSTTNYSSQPPDYVTLSVVGPTPGLVSIPEADQPSTYVKGIEHAWYGQDLLSWGPAHLLLSLRRDLTYNRSYPVAYPQFGDSHSDGAWLPGFGAVYDLSGRVSLFANVLRGFNPSFTLDANGKKLPDIRSDNIEGGVKIDFIPRALNLVASVYRLRQSNIILYDSITFLPSALPGQESKGFELDLSGEILPGWQVVASYGNASFRYLKPDPANQADYVLAQPRQKYSLYTRYTLQKGPLKDLGGALGVYGQTSAVAGVGFLYDATTFSMIDRTPNYVPAKVQVDANVYYTLGKAHLNLGVKNLFNARNYSSSGTDYFVTLDPLRAITLTLGYSFY